MASENILVCVAWPYANGDLHVGHVAGAYLPADIFARYHRLKGNRVAMVSGSDAHGTPIVVRAEKEGKTPRQVFEYFHARFVETQKAIGISYDLFTHTDTRNHHEIAQQMFRRLLENNYLFKAKQKQLYSETQGKFLPDRLVEGTCPICNYDKARGDQCDNCGNLLDAMQLINPRSRIDGSTPVVRESEHYFFDLPALREALLTYLSDKDGYWRNTVLDFSRHYASTAEPRAFTRDLTWGIPVPLPDAEGKCIYVWYEALLGYLTATVEWAALSGRPEAWQDFWYSKAGNVKIYNFIGKDNILFHTVLWPAVLLGMGRLGEPWDGAARRDTPPPVFNLPYDVPANQYLNLGGQKFSKSLGVSLDVIDLAAKYGPDPVRFYLTSIMPENKDADWSWTDFAQRNNSELLAKWGNLAQRTLSQIWKNFDQRIPTPGELSEADQAILAQSEAAFDDVGDSLGAVHLREALGKAMELATATNQYLDREAPWKTIKVDKARAATQLYVAARVIDSLSVLLSPFIPFTCEAVRRQLGYTSPLFGEQIIETVGDDNDRHTVLRYDDRLAAGAWQSSALQPGQPLGGQPKGLVAKIELQESSQ
ncbi:MAG: methionine--tRNA ligase [Anaerolineae bacterium]